jgi:hypothetical protein
MVAINAKSKSPDVQAISRPVTRSKPEMKESKPELSKVPQVGDGALLGRTRGIAKRLDRIDVATRT